MNVLFRLACLSALVAASKSPQFQNGDVVLQASRSPRAELIRKASHSPYSHVGVVEVTAKGVFVIEAVQPVKRTPIAKWLERGQGGKYTQLRAKNVDAAALEKVLASAREQLGKPYDLRFRWDDESLYCSELVTKAFASGAQLEVGRMEKVSDLALTARELAFAASQGVAADQVLVTPASIAEDDDFTVVHTDFTAP